MNSGSFHENHFFPDGGVRPQGLGVAVVTDVMAHLDAGAGFSLASYRQSHGRPLIQQTVLNVFSRFQLLPGYASKLYILAGLSRQQVGGSLPVGPVHLGLEYKYSDSLHRSHGSVMVNPGSFAPKTKAVVRGTVVQSQEFALTLNVPM